MPAGQTAGLHLHPCPVVELVLAGSILFQVEGEEVQVRARPALRPAQSSSRPLFPHAARDLWRRCTRSGTPSSRQDWASGSHTERSDCSWHQDVHGDTGWHSGRFHWKHRQAALAQTPAPSCAPGMVASVAARRVVRHEPLQRADRRLGVALVRRCAQRHPLHRRRHNLGADQPARPAVRWPALKRWGRYAMAIDPWQGAGGIAAVGSWKRTDSVQLRRNQTKPRAGHERKRTPARVP